MQSDTRQNKKHKKDMKKVNLLKLARSDRLIFSFNQPLACFLFGKLITGCVAVFDYSYQQGACCFESISSTAKVQGSKSYPSIDDPASFGSLLNSAFAAVSAALAAFACPSTTEVDFVS